MLPGFRFLFAAIVFSMSVLVFGLGAVALLRAAHQEIASTPSWHVIPETIFAQQSEATRPVLAMLRVDPPAAAQQASDDVPAPAEQAPIVSAPAEPDRIAALEPEDSSQPKTAKPEIPVSEAPAQSEAAVPAQTDAPVAADETKIAAIGEPASPASEAAAAAPEQTSASILPETDNSASAKIDTLGGPPVVMETEPSAKASNALNDESVIKKRKRERRLMQQRRAAQRARLARQAQQPTDPFAQPFGR
jgi:hypothetical protein